MQYHVYRSLPCGRRMWSLILGCGDAVYCILYIVYCKLYMNRFNPPETFYIFTIQGTDTALMA